MEDKINWDTDIWNIIDSYFKNTDNYLSKHQIESYNTFLDVNIPKTIRQFNPIVLPYQKYINPDTGEETDDYFFQIKITVGGSIDDSGNVINDGSSIFVGKPIIQEVRDDTETNDSLIYRKTLYPNEARLKNITYKCGIKANIIAEFIVRNDNGDMIRSIDPRVFNNVQITNNLPIMLRSKICSLSETTGTTSRLMGECEYDQGGYFIIDGKEKVIVAQERQIENITYINKMKGEDRFKYTSEIRSAPENKLQPARITKCAILNSINSQREKIEENAIRFIIPNINREVPIFIIFRALGIISDYDICSLIVNDFDSVIGKKIMEILKPSISEGSIINNQQDALSFIESKISSNFMTPNTAAIKRKHFLASILKDYLVPHTGTNYYRKAFFLGHMVREIIVSLINNSPATDRDSYIYKRVDISGFLISAIFRDLYFRVKNKLSENLNIFYNTKESENPGSYWNIFINQDEEDISKRNYRFYNILGETNDEHGGLPVNKLIDQSIMDEGFLYAFKNCWGLKNASGCKQGVTQDMNRLSYLGAISHIRRVNTPLSKSAKVRAPHALHLSSFGVMCPDETPDGGNIGLRKNISIFANITSGTNSDHLLRLLFTSGLEDILQIDSDKLKSTKVFLNERLVGYTKRPYFMNRKLKLLKRNALINIYTSISWNINDKVIKISTDSGRGVRPVFIVKNNKIPLTQDTLNRIKDINDIYNWYHLVGGTLNMTTAKPYEDTDSSYYIHPNENNLEKLEETAGIIEYIDPAESNQSLIAMYPRDLNNAIDKYNYCEIHPAINFGVLASCIPGIEMNQHPRNQFSTGQGKQALGIYATNFKNRMDTKGQIMFYPQKPIIKSKLAKYLRVDELPHGMNAIVALGCFSGYNQEDSIIFNKDSVERGMFKTTKFRTFSQREEVDGDKKKEFICIPDPAKTTNLKSGNYNKLDENGIIKQDIKVNENDVLIGKCVYTGEFDANGEEIISDNSEFVKRNEEGFVDRVYSNVGNNNQRYVKVRIRKDKQPEVGDKFCSRHGQKGTIGMLLPARDMPRTKTGITPDIIVNPHAFPSRMTIAQFFEQLLGKTCVHKGFLSEIVPFSENNIENVASILEEHCGFEKHGNEVLYSGITGEQLKVNFYIGPTYYLRLTHQVSDKYQARNDGLKTSLTHQPVGGRALGGGGRIGEMERDAILSHGISSFLKESFMERSDKYKFYISKKTGLISAYNPHKRIYRDISNDETEQYIDDNGNVVKRPIDETTSEFVCIEAPYTFKLFLQEVESMGIAPRLIADSIIKEWQKFNIKQKDIPTDFEIKKSKKEVEIYNSSLKISPLIDPFIKFFNAVKLQLLNKSDKDKKLIDFSSKNGADLFKWAQLRIKTIIAFDQEQVNVEGNKLKDGSNKKYFDMKSHEDPSISKWANSSDVNFIVGDISKDLFDYDVTKLSAPKYTQILKVKLTSNVKNSFNIVSHFHGVEKLFQSRDNVSNFLQNTKDSLSNGGYLLITCLDGERVFNKLKVNNKMVRLMLNKTTGKNDLIWAIQQGNVDLSKQKLSSSNKDGFNNTIRLTFNEKNLEEESLVHPTLLISMAASKGLKLVPKNELEKNYSIFNKATGTFRELFNKFSKVEQDIEYGNLNNEEYRMLKEFSDLHRYFIFKLDNNKIIPDNLFSDKQKCLQKSASTVHVNDRYPNIKLPMPICLDTNLINTYITQPRALIGKSDKLEFDSYRNRYADGSNKDFKPILENVESILAHPFYSRFTNNTYKNTIEYIFNNIKVGIYVRILNSEVIQFVPIINYNTGDTKKQLVKDIVFENSDGDTQRFETLLEYVRDKYQNSDISRIFQYNSDTININWYKEGEEGVRNNTDYIIDGENVILGDNRIELIKNKASKLRYLLETVCSEKKDNVSNCEFVINILEHPIINIRNDELDNPFRWALGESSNDLKIKGNILPILSENQINGYLDIGIPSITNIDLLDNVMSLGNCKDNVLSIPQKNLNEMPNTIGVVIDLSSSEVFNFLENYKDIEALLEDQDDDYKSEFDPFLLKPSINNTINGSIMSITKNSKLIEYINTPELFKFPVDAKVQLYLPGNNPATTLPLQCKSSGVLVTLKSTINTHKPWFFSALKKFDYRIYQSGSKIEGHYIEINDLNEIKDIMNFLIDNEEACDALIKNKRTLINKLFNKDGIIDYLQLVINKIGEKSNYEQTSIDIFKSEIQEQTNEKSLLFPTKLLGTLIGKGGSKIKTIQNTTSTNIKVGRDKIEEQGEEKVNITIRGGISGVNIAHEIITKVLNTKSIYTSVLSRKVAQVIGKKREHLNIIEAYFNVKVLTVVSDQEKLDYFRSEYPEDSDSPEKIDQLNKDWNIIKVVGENQFLPQAVEAIQASVKGNFKSALMHINRELSLHKPAIQEKVFTYHTDDSILFNKDTYIVDDDIEELPHGWIKLPEEDYPLTAKSLIYNFGVEREVWNAEENADRLPTRYPQSWDENELETNNISIQAMHNYLQANFNMVNNWRSGVEILKETQPIMRPTLMIPGETTGDFPISPAYGNVSPTYGVDSPGYVPTSPTYGVNSPGYVPQSPTYGSDSPGYVPQSPTYGSDSPGEQYVPTPPPQQAYDEELSAAARQDLDFSAFDQSGGEIADIKHHRDNNSVLIAIPFENKNVHIGENISKLTKYVDKLKTELNKYILKQKSMGHMNFKIIILKHNKDIMKGKDIILSGLSDLRSKLSPIDKLIEDNESIAENKYKTHFNKGALYNIAGNVAMHDSHIRNIILHPVGYIPNHHMIAHYFDNPMSSVHLLSIDNEFNGPILMSKKTFFKNSFPNHIWSDFNTNLVYEKILKNNNIPIKKFIDINAKWTEFPDISDMDDYMQSNELVDLDAVYYEQNNIVRNKWYQTKNIQVISDNSSIYEVDLDFNCNPISNINNSFIWQMVNKDKSSHINSGNHHNTITNYLGRYIKYTLDEEVEILKSKENIYDSIKISISDDMIKLINIILRIRIVISVFKSFIISNYSEKLPIMKHSNISLTLDEENNINLKLVNKDSENDELFVDINEVLRKPTVTNRVATYKFMDVKNFDYENVRSSVDNLLMTIRKQNIESIKPDQLARFNTIRKSIDTSKYIILEKLGDTDVIFDSKTDSVKYLNLHDQSITDYPKNDNLKELTDNEFYIAMKYKLSKKLDIEDSGIIDVINSDYFERYVPGEKVVISDKIGKIIDVSLTNLKILVDKETVNVEINPENPSENVLILDDLLVDKVDIRNLEIEGTHIKVIGKYINKNGEKMMIISSLDDSYQDILNYTKYIKKSKDKDKKSSDESLTKTNVENLEKHKSEDKSSIEKIQLLEETKKSLLKDLQAKYSIGQLSDYITNPTKSKEISENLNQSRLPFFCEALSKMKPLNIDLIKDRRNLIYRVLIKRFNITDDLLLLENSKKLMNIISNIDFIDVLFRSYDITFFNRKYRRYTGILGCRSIICFDGNCFESSAYKTLSKKTDTILSIDIDTFQIKKNIEMIHNNDSLTSMFKDSNIDNIIKYIMIIFEHELVNSFINCFCLSHKKNITNPKIEKSLAKTIVNNLFGHSEEIQQLMIKK